MLTQCTVYKVLYVSVGSVPLVLRSSSVVVVKYVAPPVGVGTSRRRVPGRDDKYNHSTRVVEWVPRDLYHDEEDEDPGPARGDGRLGGESRGFVSQDPGPFGPSSSVTPEDL